MLVFKDIFILRQFVNEQKFLGKKIGLLTTMGALHDGHGRLMEIVKQSSDIIIVSIFVNRLQFNVVDDFVHYPRDLEKDVAFCLNMSVDVVFAPSEDDIYPNGMQNTCVTVNQLDKNLCGRTRPLHFLGVSTVLNKFFNIITPDLVFFGKKDIQQLRIVETMVKELNFPIKVVGCDTIRAKDGLALSSRNKHLSEKEREESVIVPQLLNHIVDLIENGELSVSTLIKKGKLFLNNCKIAKLDYLEIVDHDQLQILDAATGTIIIAVAVFIGTTRLIDNIIYKV